jgi:tetratricopeptide (TPR) repeat protein
MKSKSTYLVVALVLAVLYIGDEQRWFRQTRAAAQTSPLPNEECEKLAERADPAAKACYTKLSQSRDPFAKAEGLWGLGNGFDASLAFADAVKANPKDPARHVRWGYLWMSTDQFGDAKEDMDAALKINPDYAPAMLGMARVLNEAFDGEATKWAEKAVKADPKMYQAYELMARMHLEDNNPEKATAAAKEALAITPNALQALSILAAIDMMDDKPGTEWTDRIFQANPKYGEAYETIGHFFVQNRRYDEGIKLLRKALELKPELWSARAQLGVQLMRFGQEEEAQKQLATVFNDGPKPARLLVKNSLKLLDVVTTFETFKTPTTVLKFDKTESALLRPYFQQEMDRAIETYEKKYKYKLDGPVQVEVYPNHPDFEVRTIGMPGLGALGVTFGKVVAMDSPNSRTPGEFHWAATLWHEMSHVYLLTMTKSRTPRWFTEGVAVFEETAISPEWGDRMTPREVKAIQEKKLLPIAELERGYVHPTYPDQVIVSYFQGGRVITYIVEKWGQQAILDMIKGFTELKTTPEVLKEVLKITPEEFDAQFFPWLEAQTKRTVDGFEGWTKQMKDVNAAVKAKEWDKVITLGTEARETYPDFVSEANVYDMLVKAYLEKGDKAKAIATLEAWATHGGRDPDTLKKLAELQAEAGHKKEAAAALEKLSFIFLKDEKAHQQLGALEMELNNPQLAIREFGAALASGTIDLAGTHYNLAVAYKATKQNELALEHVFQALEAAPSYKPAQKLLLELNPQ